MAASILNRRAFVRIAAVGGVLLPSPSLAQGEKPEDVAPPKDLMREHGVLKRVLLAYREVIRRVNGRGDVPSGAVKDAADVIRTFIEDYHEKLEEDYLFPRFEKAHKLTDLTSVLRAQHQAGRRLTDQIAHSGTSPTGVRAMEQFIRMYEPHEAREDTVLFPALRSVVSAHEFDSLGEEFEKKEHALFGEDGFEKRLGIYDLSQFTPRL